MATTTAWIERQKQPTVASGIATVDSGETTSLDIPCGGRAVVTIGVPTIDSGNLTFLYKPWPDGLDADGNTMTSAYRVLKDASGNTVTVASSVGGFTTVIPELAGCYSFQIVCGTAQSSGAVAFEVSCTGPYPTAYGTTALTPVFAAISGATSGNNTLVAADATKKIRVLSMNVIAASAVDFRLESAAGGTALTGVMSLGANGGFVLPYNPLGHFETVATELLNMELGGAVQVSGSLVYVLV